MFTSATGIRNHNGLIHSLQAWLDATVGWTVLEYTAADQEADPTSAHAINNAGTGYVALEVLTLVGGTFTTATQIRIDTVGGSGEVLTFTVVTNGEYSVIPSNPISTSGGSGSLASFDMVFTRIATDQVTLSLEGPGAGAGKRVYINLETDNDVGSGFYSWRMYGATGWAASTPFGSLPGAGGPSYYNLWQNDTDYWFYANDRHFKVVSKVSTNYMSMYAGFHLPVGLPSEYPFPQCLIGSYPSMELPDVNNARNSSIADPGRDGAAWYRRRTTETWTEIRNHNSSSFSVSPTTGERAFIWPHKTGRVDSSPQIGDPDEWGAGGFESLRLNANNEAPLIQCHIIDMQDRTIVGALDGVYSTTGFNRSTEQTIAVGGRTFRLFQRAFRNQAGDFFAVEEI